jgi:hypothetical protein
MSLKDTLVPLLYILLAGIICLLFVRAGRRGPIKPLGKRRKQLAFLVIAIGVCTFFVPLTDIDPPVLGRTQWSALNIASQIYQQKLPVPQGRFDPGLTEITLIYVFMMFALVALAFSLAPEVLRVIALFGTVLSSLAKWWGSAFVWTFFGYFGAVANWRVRPGPAWYVLPFVMPALLLISLIERRSRQQN